MSLFTTYGPVTSNKFDDLGLMGSFSILILILLWFKGVLSSSSSRSWMYEPSLNKLILGFFFLEKEDADIWLLGF